MSKKWAISGFLIVAFCGAIAFVGAQEQSRTPQNQTSRSTDRELSWQLRNAQQAVVREYSNRSPQTRTQQAGAPQNGSAVRQAGLGMPAGSRGRFVQTAAFLPDDQEPEVPTILSGRPRDAQSKPGSAQSGSAQTGSTANGSRTQPAPANLQPTRNSSNAPATLPNAGRQTGQGGLPTAAPIQRRSTTESGSSTQQSAAPSQLTPMPANRMPANSTPANGMRSPDLAKPAQLPTQINQQLNGANGQPLAPANLNSGNQAVEEAANNLQGPEARTAALPTSPNPTRSAAAAALSFDSIGPQLRVMTDGPKSIRVGKPATYRIRTSNLSNVAAENVSVMVKLPEWASVIDTNVSTGQIDRANTSAPGTISWILPTVEAVSVHELELEIMVNENRPFDLDVSWQTERQGSIGRVAVTQPKLDLQIVGPAEINFGEKADFAITVANVGNGDAENVAVSLPPSLGGERTVIGNIAAGKSQTFEVELIAREQGMLNIGAQATADGDLTKSAEHAILVRRGRLEVELIAPEFKFAGSLVAYRVSIANTGDAISKGVMAAVALPAGAEYRAGVEGAESVDGGVRWNVGDLAPGSKLQYDLQVVLNEAGTAQIEGGARDGGGLAARDAAETVVEAVAELTLDVVDPKGPRAVGEVVVYELIVRNRGTKTAHNVNLVAQFSSGIDPTEGIGQGSKIADGQVIFNPIATVTAGQEIRLKVKAKASEEGNHIFRAHLTSDNPETHRVFEGTTRYFDLSNGGTRPSEGSGQIQGLNRPSNVGSQPSLRMPSNK